MSISKYVQK